MKLKVPFTNAASNGALIFRHGHRTFGGATLAPCIVMGSCVISIVASGLTNGVAYTFTVTATNAAGTGQPPPSMPVTPADVPGPPVIGSATAG